MMRVLDTRNITVREELTVRGEAPRRWIYRGEVCICNEEDDYSRAIPFLLAAGSLRQKRVAWIGGGFCIGPRAFAVANCDQTVFEQEPALEEFCPDGVRFVPGPWRDTIQGLFDVIIYDVGGEIPRDELDKYLKPEGAVLA